jgi:hypothetical protein
MGQEEARGRGRLCRPFSLTVRNPLHYSGPDGGPGVDEVISGRPRQATDNEDLFGEDPNCVVDDSKERTLNNVDLHGS